MFEILLKFFLKWTWYYLSHQVRLRGAHVKPGWFGSYWKTPGRLPFPCTHVSCQCERAGWDRGNPGQGTQRGVNMAGCTSEQTCPAAWMQPLPTPWGVRGECTDENHSREALLNVFVLKINLLQGHTLQRNRHWLVPLSQPPPWVELILYLPW